MLCICSCLPVGNYPCAVDSCLCVGDYPCAFCGLGNFVLPELFGYWDSCVSK